MRDQNLYFMKQLGELGLTLADLSVDSFEAWHRIQKMKTHQDVSAGGKGHPFEAIMRLLVPSQRVYKRDNSPSSSTEAKHI